MQSTTKRQGLSPIDGRPIEIHVESGRIAAIEPLAGPAPAHWIAPAMIDIQVNGFAGVDYNSPDTPQEDLARSIDVQIATGVARLLPTVITGSHENICGSLSNLARARRDLPNGEAFVGFHVEGPWISPLDGPRGAHPVQHCRAATPEEFDRFQEAAEGGIRLVTLAPEVAGAIPTIEHMAKAGVVVAIGHSNASEADIHNAIAAGATMSTHLGNGAHQIIPRHANYITWQMAADELSAGLIVDGIHLPPAFVKVAVRAKGANHVILVTDAAPPASCAPGIYHFGHLEVALTEDQCIRLTDSGRLAGSALSMDRGLENLIRFSDLDLLGALRAGTVNAAREIHLKAREGFLQVGDPADLMLFDYDQASGGVTIRETLLGDLN
ncbi:MAG: N-acetylglucosamine-6-phosphate deacetylase [Acidobacteria bacterium]|nr:N-acetylglucosamine-6-phosphate deacetylase [Acidobacteriota bacterium]